MNWRWRYTALLPLLILLMSSCSDDPTPKPRAYVRMELPTPAYIGPDTANWNCPYYFEASKLSYLTVDKRHQGRYCWYNVYYPKFNATIHLTYSGLHGDLNKHIEENRKLAMKHIGKATQIDERRVDRPTAAVHGLVYEFKGATASDMQFFVTDSTDHFLRGSLYFNVRPNKDSLQPVIDYVKADIDHLIQSVRWLDSE